jgi:hypothetical protein
MTDVTLGRHKVTRLGNTTLRLVLRDDGLDWIAEGHPEWRRPDGSIKIAAVATAAGLHRQAVTRIVIGGCPDNSMIAAITVFGAKTRRVAYKTAMDRLFRVIDLTEHADSGEAAA